MADSIDRVRADLEAESLDTDEQIETFRIKYLGRKQGVITDLFSGIRHVEGPERGAYGQRVNELKRRAEERIDEAKSRGASAAIVDRPDVTLPGRPLPVGSLHPITQTAEEIRRVFARLGYSVAEGPEIEDDFHNFTALNFPPNHPARDMQDTLFLEPPPPQGRGVLLRTHTSPVQIRVMESSRPPYRVIVPGRVYRNEAISYKSYCLFHQVEGLCIDEGVTMADLKETLRLFAREMFGSDVVMRFRPSFFPFTEPSAEVDILWKDDSGNGGRWLEILGCGMVDPNVLEAVDVDPERYTGFAFGMGIERIAMLRHGIDDIRLLYENDVRFLTQF
ncbi:MAG TPA: phenylalanine--tRNA ligase subunit alpha [Rhodothermia bacterium]|nr:phenylalanine--tRNA ligase subunit alpha [Rhodothermia bacterium]